MKLTPSPRLFLLLILGIPFSLQAEDYETTDQTARSSIQTKSYVNDTVIWKDEGKNKIEIPVCWESLASTNVAGKDWNAETQRLLENSWEAESSMEFTGWQQCPNSHFKGVRITVESTPHPEKSGLPSPYALALGNNLIGKKRGLVLNFSLTSDDTLAEVCSNVGQGLEDCIQSSIVHEFGHVLGFSHEQNRPDDPYGNVSVDITNLPPITVDNFFDFCRVDDPLTNEFDPNFLGTPFHGNTLFTVFDKSSIMNYCNKDRFKMTKPSPLDSLALRVYYGRMPTYDAESGRIEIPRVDVTYFDEHREIVRSTNKITLEKKANKTGPYSVTSKPITQLESSAEAKFANSNLHIPEIALIQGQTLITEIWRANLTRHADGSYTIHCGTTKRTHPEESDWLC